MDREKLVAFLRRTFGKESAKKGARTLFIKIYKIAASESFWKKILNIAVFWAIWSGIIWLFYAGTGDIMNELPANPRMRKMVYFVKGGYWMFAFYPVMLFWSHCTEILTDKEVKKEAAIERGDFFYRYRRNKLHYKGYGVLLVFFLFWFVMIGALDHCVPGWLFNIVICIPATIHFLPELLFIYNKVKGLICKTANDR